ncbi:methyltransferase domain-containing protein [Niastella caeni]|uniref:Methyltransferase domain-containing protein n=1 Tax=Niastella caeni TaxID=2569763 RepID=A0A4S8HEK1_9BACT|nr:methyltransferase domain-containing protein [Niastella caeni]THU33498.1 methyltransferase domain-containing protein [Niastella caeni]
MNFRHRSYQHELLDRPDIPFEDIKRNMQELNFINTWLGGHAITITGVEALVNKNGPVTICEIGCGGGDNLAAIQKWCEKRNIKAAFIGIDINPHCIDVAANRQLNNTQLIASDYKEVQLEMQPDIIFSSLFCHHFSDREMVKILQWMKTNARLGFFINDLHRHRLAYYSIKVLTALFSNSYLVKHDAPLSVARGFTKDEWLQFFNIAGISNFSIEWKWAFRWLIVFRNTEAGSSKPEV